MHNPQLPDWIDIETHRVSASYHVVDQIGVTPIGITGHKLTAIVDDLITFLGSLEEHSDDYELTSVIHHGDDDSALEIVITSISDAAVATVYAVQN